jgi:hypothetical protein
MIKNTKKILQDITDLTAALLDVPAKDINGGGRARVLVLGRVASANFLMRDLGYTYDELSKHIDRDRTSFYYYESKHNDNYKYWREYKQLYDNLKKSYLGIDNMAMTKEDMLKVFKDKDIVNQEAAPFMISFKIGNIEEYIYTRELEDTIKVLKEAFKQFNYSFSVEHINSLAYES